MYSTKPGKESFANNCLLDKLVEKGVRYVQLFDCGWDSHGTYAGDSIEISFVNKCRSVDQCSHRVITRSETKRFAGRNISSFRGEFGRTPMQENREGKQQSFKGRDHHRWSIYRYGCGGGGIKRGTSFGETDPIGYSPISGKVTPFDIQATILNQLGFDHWKIHLPVPGSSFQVNGCSRTGNQWNCCLIQKYITYYSPPATNIPMPLSRRKFISTSAAFSGALIAPFQQENMSRPSFSIPPDFRIVVMQPLTGAIAAHLTTYCAKAKQEGYDGIELWWQSDPKRNNACSTILKT